MSLLIDRRAYSSGDVGARRTSNVEQLLCEFQGTRECDGNGLRRDLAPRKVVPCVKRRSLDGPLRHGSSETGELVLAQNDLDHAAPASASERAWTRCPETTGGSRRASEERRDLVEGYRKPLDRRFERGQGYA